MITITKGLDIPIAGAPEQSIDVAPAVHRVALVGDDSIGMRPTMAVAEGDRVKLGQVLFEDKKTPGVLYTSPGAGSIAAIHRGARRKFQSIVIELEGDEQETFRSFETRIHGLDPGEVRENLVTSGLWPALRTRPYNKVPSPESDPPQAIFVTAMDTNPLAPDAALVINDYRDEFTVGLQVLCRLTEGTVHLCRGPDTDVPVIDDSKVRVEEFAGPHPAGLPGTHIHFLHPVDGNRTVWFVGYQDVVAIGRLFLTGRLWAERVISVAGPVVREPGVVRAPLGSSVDDLLRDRLTVDNARVISGSVLSGRAAVGPYAFLGRYHLQVCAISDDVTRPFLGWLGPGLRRFSVKPVYASALRRDGRRYEMTTSAEGSHRPIVPVGTFEKVMPLDFVITALLKAIASDDTVRAQELGCLELDEEDLALCGFVCPGKTNYGPMLREILTRIEKEG